VIDQSAIEREIRAGLPNESARRDEFRRNALYFDGEFGEDVAEWLADTSKAPARFTREDVRTSRVMRRVVEVLTSNLYRIGPERSIQGRDAASEWLNTLYQDEAVDALWQEADRLSLVNHVAAFEVYADEDEPGQPDVRLWGGEELCVWTQPGNPRDPGAVATRYLEDNRQVVRLWTPDQVVEFATDKLTPGQTSGGRLFREVKREPNPWGFLPFAFVHADYPARYFTPTGPPAGTYLRVLNFHLNYRLSQIACDVNKTRPIGVIEGGSDFEFKPRRAGLWDTLPALSDAGGGLISAPQARYVTCDLSYLSTDWDDLRAYLDHALEMLAVPPVAVRMEQAGARSGVSIVAEQVPLAQWAESRTRPFSRYERNLARLVLRAGAVLGSAPGLQEAADTEGGLTLRWPEMLAEVPGPERDQHDQWMLDNGLMSRKQWLMLRERLTGDEAEIRLTEIQDERKAEQEAMTPPQLQGASNGNPNDQPPVDAAAVVAPASGNGRAQ
jgi:hypothetical protein